MAIRHDFVHILGPDLSVCIHGLGRRSAAIYFHHTLAYIQSTGPKKGNVFTGLTSSIVLSLRGCHIKKTEREEEREREQCMLWCFHTSASFPLLLLLSKMQVISRQRLLWIYFLLLTFLQLWGRLSSSSSTSSPTLPAPSLGIYFRSEASVVLTCKVPQGYNGVLFMLYRVTDKVDSHELQSGAEEVHFTVEVKEDHFVELYCCLYKDNDGLFSAFSPYLRLEHQKAVPTQSPPLFPPPVLSVVPSTGVVKCGDMLSFTCSVPTPIPQSQSQSGVTNTPVTFHLLRTAEQTGAASVLLQPQASLVSGPERPSGVFTVGPVRGGDDGEYTCMYQITNKRQLVNSTVSNVIQVTVKDMLPPPTLVLHQQTDVWHLLCVGSPSYPGAVFSLCLADSEHPIDTVHAKIIHHQASFPVPVQDPAEVLYQCQYSVLLGKKWSRSEPSQPLAVTRERSPPPSSGLPGVDWPLVLGCFSAVVLVLCSVALAVIVTHRKVKAAAEKKKNRQDAQFWTQVHAKDHVVDLTLRRSNFNSQEWPRGETEMASRSPLWNTHSTFTTPIH
ncbi:leukocyte immunoglobulin-like receptor subfamily A member 6 isoform X1 [Solea senegalensis]|uniref:Leukocyte immunoglobulin-like receptor subfamily A member 6 isoform X1 n=1 Tax=Solea senegalensis TaxID=28829 RepID=A0AAV6Q7J4_SOLSE|nr:leukocyte immunoglobulin-like receptor subfamily A member 6 isoform X1 [Solea senegalensis]